VAIRFCSACGRPMEGGAAAKCAATGGAHKLARADFEKQEADERREAAKKKPGYREA
jgi:hypothetical protein